MQEFTREKLASMSDHEILQWCNNYEVYVQSHLTYVNTSGLLVIQAMARICLMCQEMNKRKIETMFN